MNADVEKKIDGLQKVLVVNRIRILELLDKENTCVCQMVWKLHVKHSLLSHHLRTLTDLGYLTSIRNGQHIVYGIVKRKKSAVKRLLNLVRSGI